jgi:nucleoside-diphosphate-sugar epimerase
VRVLVTGGTSMLGAATAQRLAAAGHDVTCFQRGVAPGDLRTVRGDITDRRQVDTAVAGHDAVVHLAALVTPRAPWAQFLAVNVDGTANVLAAVRRCQRFVHISSPSVAFTNRPAVNEPALPANPHAGDRYTRSKATAERLVLDTADKPPTTVIRPHLVWGPGDTQLIGRIVAKSDANRLFLPGGGTALIDTTYVDNAAASIAAALDACVPNSPALDTPLVVSNGEPRPVAELVDRILVAMGRTPNWKSVHPRLAALGGRVVEAVWRGPEPPITYFAARQLTIAHWYDQTQTRHALDWAPHVSLDEGFRRLAEYSAHWGPGSRFRGRSR